MKKLMSILLTLALLLAMVPSSFAAAKYTFKSTADTYGAYIAFTVEGEDYIQITSYKIDKKGVYRLDPAIKEVKFTEELMLKIDKVALSKDKSSFDFTYDDLVTETIKKTGKDTYELSTAVEGDPSGTVKILRYKDVNTMVAAIKKDKKLAELYKKATMSLMDNY